MCVSPIKKWCFSIAILVFRGVLIEKTLGNVLLFRMFRLVSYGFCRVPKVHLGSLSRPWPCTRHREHQSLIPFLQRDLSYAARKKHLVCLICFNGILVGGWTNPSEKYARQIWESSPSRDENNKCLQPPPSILLMVQKSGDHHLGCIKTLEVMGCLPNWLAGFLNHQQYWCGKGGYKASWKL